MRYSYAQAMKMVQQEAATEEAPNLPLPRKKVKPMCKICKQPCESYSDLLDHYQDWHPAEYHLVQNALQDTDEKLSSWEALARESM